MAWTAPKTYVAGAVHTAAELNTYERDNMLALTAGRFALSGQAAGDDMFAISTTQWAVGARQLRQTFDGLTIRTHPDADKAAYQLLANCRECVMQDGARVADWRNILFDVSVSGAGGRSAGVELASTWYEPYLIRNSSTNAKAGLLHRAKSFDLDQSQTTTTAEGNLIYSTGVARLSQGFTPAVTGYRSLVELALAREASGAGNAYVEIQTDAAGSPSGVVLATSNLVDYSLLPAAIGWYFFEFATPVSLTAGTPYHYVLRSTGSISTTNYLEWRANGSNSYAGGVAKRWDGAAWQTSSVSGFNAVDFAFRDYVTQNDVAVSTVLPTGYDQYCKVGWAYNDSSSNFIMMNAQEKFVSLGGVSMGTFTTTDPILVLAGAALPPAPVTARFMSSVNGAGDTSLGLFADISNTSGGAFRWLITLPTVSRFYGPVDVPVRPQRFYAYNNNTIGTITAYLIGFKW